MGMMTVRNIPEEVHDALRAQAKTNGRSAEAEVRFILEAAVKPKERLRMGQALAAIGRKHGVTDEDIALLDQARDRRPAEPMSFE